MKLKDLEIGKITIEFESEEFLNLIGYALESPNIPMEMCKKIEPIQNQINTYYESIFEHIRKSK